MARQKHSYLNSYVNLFRKNYNYLIYSFLHFFFSALGQTFLIGIFKPYFICTIDYFDRLPVEKANDEFSLIYMSCTLLSGLIIFFLGPVIDRTRIRNFSLVNGILLLGFAVILSRSQGIALFITGLFGVRFCGQGLMPLIGSTGTARYFDQDRGKALAISTMGISLGEALLPPVIAALFTFGINGGHIWQFLGLMVLVIFIPFVHLLIKKDDAYQTAPGHRTKKGKNSVGRKKVMADPKFYVLLLTYVFPAFLFTGVFANPDLFEIQKGYEPQWMAYALTGYGGFRLFSTLIVGPLVDRYGATKLFPFALLPLFVGLLLLLLFDQPWMAFVFTTLTGVTMSFGSLCSSAMWPEIYGTRYLGAIKSINTTFMIFATAAAIKIFNWSLQHFPSLDYTIIPCLCLIIVLSTTSFIVTRKLKKVS